MTQTRSGLPVRTFGITLKDERRTYAHEHPWLVRFTHWLNAVSLAVMTASGLQIFMAFPSFGEKIPQADFLHIPEAMRLGSWLGGALQWHYSFAWLFTLTGLSYLSYLIASGHWRRVILQPNEIKGIWPMVRHYFFFKAKPAEQEAYNPLQKVAYTLTIFLGGAAILTGLLLAKPVQFGAAVRLFGGFGMIRIYHFLSMAGFLAFIPGHLLMVALHGWKNFSAMLTGWKRDPAYLAVPPADRPKG